MRRPLSKAAISVNCGIVGNRKSLINEVRLIKNAQPLSAAKVCQWFIFYSFSVSHNLPNEFIWKCGVLHTQSCHQNSDETVLLRRTKFQRKRAENNFVTKPKFYPAIFSPSYAFRVKYIYRYTLSKSKWRLRRRRLLCVQILLLLKIWIANTKNSASHHKLLWAPVTNSTPCIHANFGLEKKKIKRKWNTLFKVLRLQIRRILSARSVHNTTALSQDEEANYAGPIYAFVLCAFIFSQKFASLECQARLIK